MTGVITIHDMPQRSQEWFEVRLGRVTGSIASKYFNSYGKLKQSSVLQNNISKQVAELLLGFNEDSQADTYDMARGREMEDIALMDLYEKGYCDVGFVTNSNHPHFGVSPDAVFMDDQMAVTTGVEVKSPTSNYHTRYLLTKKVANDYKPQIGLQFVLIPTIERVIFRSFNPSFEGKNKTLEIVIEREDWKDYLTNLENSMVKLGAIIDESVGKLKSEL